MLRAPGIDAQPMAIYDEIGGRAVVDLVVDLFYRRLLADPDLAPYFANVDLADQIRRQCSFMAFALGRLPRYDGGSIRETHRPLSLGEAEFAGVAKHLAAALAEIGVAAPLIARVMTVVATTKGDVLDLPSAAPAPD